MTLCFVFLLLPSASAEQTVSKRNTVYDIAVVYDNSGSMYYSGNKAWSRAKYSMEIFASMLDYENGDCLTIFPMWKVSTNSNTGNGGDLSDVSRIDIRNKNDVSKIRNMYTFSPSNTPLEPIDEALEYLTSHSDANGSGEVKKWLIVLTDGEFDEDERGEAIEGVADDLLIERLNKAAGKVTVQYLGMGDAAKNLTGNSALAPNVRADKAGETQIMDKLVEICNSIFNRPELTDKKYFDGTNLNLPLTMNKLIVFVQGEGAKIEGLVSSDGKQVNKLYDSGSIVTNDISAGGPCAGQGQVDTTLAGQVVTFDHCDIGEYTLKTVNAKKVQVFYEPDIRIDLVVSAEIDGQWQEFTLESGDLTPGVYGITPILVDAVTGENAADSGLLGKTEIEAILESKSASIPSITIGETGQNITLNGGDIFIVTAHATYLDGEFTITSTDFSGFPSEISCEMPAEHELDVDVSVKEAWYSLTDIAEWKPIEISVRLDGNKLTDEELSDMISSGRLAFEFDKDIPYSGPEIIPGESAVNIYIGRNAEGSILKPAKDSYTITATGNAVDEFNREMADSDSETFSVNGLPKWVVWLIGFLIFLLIALLVFLFLMQKVLPKNIVHDTSKFALDDDSDDIEMIKATVKYDRKGKTLRITTPATVDYEAQAAATFTLKPIDRRYVASKKRRISIVGVSSSNCNSVTINGVIFEKYESGKWNKKGLASNQADKPFEQNVKNALFILKGGSDDVSTSTLTCKVKHK